VRWGAHAAAILNGAMWQPPRAGGHDDKAHPPIHPTRHSAGEADWGPGEQPTLCRHRYLSAVRQLPARWQSLKMYDAR
jgi:hypothetical protein